MHRSVITLGIATLAALCLIVPPSLEARTRVTMSKAEGFVTSELERVAVVTTECSDVVDCAVIERKVFSEARQMRVEFTIIPGSVVKDFLLKQGRTQYAPELREALAVEFELDGIFELKVPHAEAGDGPWGRRGSKAKVEMLLVRPSGEILIHATGTGRPMNVVTSPETVAGNIVEEMLERVFK